MAVRGQIAHEVWEWPATGTTWRIHHAGGVDSAAAQRVADAVERDEARWSRFRPHSEVCMLSAAAGRWVRLSRETLELLELAERWSRHTARLFQPPAVDVDAAASCARIPAGEVLDLGGIARSHMAVRAGRLLADVTGDLALLVDAGGDLVAVRGEHIVAIERHAPSPPNRPGDTPLGAAARVRLRAGHGVATSGDGRRRWRPAPAADATVLAPDPVQAGVMAECLALRPSLIARCELPAMATAGGVTRHSPSWLGVLA